MKLGKLLFSLKNPNQILTKETADFVNANVKVLEKIVTPESMVIICVSDMFRDLDDTAPLIPWYIVKTVAEGLITNADKPLFTIDAAPVKDDTVVADSAGNDAKG